MHPPATRARVCWGPARRQSTDGLPLTRVRRRRHGVHLHHHLLRGHLLLLVGRAVHDASVGVDHHAARNGGDLHVEQAAEASAGISGRDPASLRLKAESERAVPWLEGAVTRRADVSTPPPPEHVASTARASSTRAPPYLVVDGVDLRVGYLLGVAVHRVADVQLHEGDVGGKRDGKGAGGCGVSRGGPSLSELVLVQGLDDVALCILLNHTVIIHQPQPSITSTNHT